MYRLSFAKLFLGVVVFSLVCHQVWAVGLGNPKIIPEGDRRAFLQGVVLLEGRIFNEGSFGLALSYAAQRNPVKLNDFLPELVRSEKWFKERLLYSKFALDEQVRWLDWNMRQDLRDFKGQEREVVFSFEKMANEDAKWTATKNFPLLANYWLMTQNSQLVKLKLALANLLIQRIFGFQFLIKVETLADKYRSGVLKDLGHLDEPQDGTQYEVAAGIFDKVIPELR
jgi:hypothetical protein